MAPTGNKPKHAGKAIVAGGVSGAIEICCTYPLEFTKTVSQLDKSSSGGAMAVVRNTMRTAGPLGFYRGLSSMVYFATPKAAIRFSAFEQASGALTGKDGKPMFPAAGASRPPVPLAPLGPRERVPRKVAPLPFVNLDIVLRHRLR